MKWRYSGLVLALCCSSVVARAALPDDWQAGGFEHQGFTVDTDSHEKREDKPVLVIRSTPSIATEGEANAGTAFAADRYRGKRLRFTAELRSEQVQKWSGLWMRVSGAGSEGQPARDRRLRYDNMRKRPVKGTTAWARYAIVLDVPNEAKDLAIGFFLVGPGTIWMSNPTLEEVGPEVPVTSITGSNLSDEPQLNLGKQ